MKPLTNTNNEFVNHLIDALNNQGKSESINGDSLASSVFQGGEKYVQEEDVWAQGLALGGKDQPQ